MTDRYRMSRLFRDDVTRLVIPNNNIIKVDAITNIISSYVTNPTRNSYGFFSTKDKFGEKISESFDNALLGSMERLMDAFVIGLGVTKISTMQEYTMPFSKGIGSTGEIIHLLGAKNEMINIEFKTDRYPGRLGYILRGILQKVLESAEVVYLIDDLFLATPCLIKKTKLSKDGVYRGAIIGQLELVSLSTGGSFIKDTIGGNDRVKNTTTKLKNSVDNIYKSLTPFQKLQILGVGSITITTALLGAVLGYGS